MALTRRVETFAAGYFGVNSESTVMTAEPMQDLDSPAGKARFGVTARAKQYLDFATPVIVKNAAVALATNLYSYQRLGAFVTTNPALTGTPTVTMDAAFIPTYFMKGARGMNNNRTAAKIDTTGSGDIYQNGVPGRPDASISFTLVTGSKVTNKAGKLVTIESMLMAAADAAVQCVFSFIDDTTDPLNPRDVMYTFVGTANKTRGMGAPIERAIDGYIAVPDDGGSPVVSIDFIA